MKGYKEGAQKRLDALRAQYDELRDEKFGRQLKGDLVDYPAISLHSSDSGSLYTQPDLHK